MKTGFKSKASLEIEAFAKIKTVKGILLAEFSVSQSRSVCGAVGTSYPTAFSLKSLQFQFISDIGNYETNVQLANTGGEKSFVLTVAPLC